MQKEKHLFWRLRKILFLSLFLVMSVNMMFAQVRITGTVTDAGGGPLIGVNVIERGTVNGAITDIDGNFTLNVASTNSVLVFSYVGFTTQEVPVGNNTRLTVVLAED